MISNPESTSTSGKQGPSEPARPPEPAPPRAIEVGFSRPWSIGLGVALALITAGTVASGARALVGIRDSAQVREELAAIHGELIRIRQVLETDQDQSDDDDEDFDTQRTGRVDVSGAPMLGSRDAPLTLVEFTDFQCPFCARFHAETFPLLRKADIETGRLRYVAMDFPLTGIHRDALRAARASHCGEAQGRYWEVHDALFRQRGRLGRGPILKAVRRLGLNTARFAACMDSTDQDGRIEEGISRGSAIGVSGTPTFVLGRTQGSSVEGRVIVGAQPFEVFSQLIDMLAPRT